METKHIHNSLETQLEGKEKDFYEFHGVQLIAVNFPPQADLIKELHNKLERSIFDAGEYFDLLVNEDTESFEVKAKKDLVAGQNVFIIDHAFSFRYPELRTALEQNQFLKERLSSMLTFSDKKRTHPEYPKTAQQNATVPILEFDNQEIEDPSTVEVTPETLGLSFWGNNISDYEKLKQVLDKLPNLKVLWLNENPIAENLEELIKWIETNYKNIQIVNSQFTHNVDAWGVKFATLYPNLDGFETIQPETFRYLDLSSRNIFHLEDFKVFSEFKRVKSINVKTHEMKSFEDTNKLFALMKTIPNLKDIECEGQIHDVLWELKNNNKIYEVCSTLESINGYDLLEGKPKEEEDDIQNIIKNIWKIAGTYRLATSEQLDETSVWYVLDEFGSGITQNNNPNASVKPFLYAPNNKFDSNVISYSILWLTKDVKEGEVIFQNYLEGTDESKGLLSKLRVWYDIPDNVYVDAFKKREEKLDAITQKAQEKIKNHVTANAEESKKDLVQPKLPLKVATDYEVLVERLISKNYEIVKGFDEADILWIITSLKDDPTFFQQGKFINQFPNEVCIAMKNNLAKTVNEGVGNVKWLQPTYNLSTELNEFVGDFITRSKNHNDNHWIIKPPNMARSLDMVITDNLDTILRLMETGPRLAQKYIHRPLRFRKKKIDHRFIVIVRSIKPLEVFIYKTFMTRTSNNRFTLDPRSIDNYETHFTIMTYSGRKQDEIDPEWFIQTFNQENKANNMTWDNVYARIKEMVKEAFVAVAETNPEMHNNLSRAIYGMDVMVDSKYQPKLLEFTFSPDCKRPSTLSPTFFNDIFDCFFLGQERNMDRVI